ncbi:MAG TPA: M20/M25/M40 family metallo-hydrolase [Terriglobia bacterium]|nr:M20/M25/M40 family metallo-hydrolase [Terriglobia bacterium]
MKRILFLPVITLTVAAGLFAAASPPPGPATDGTLPALTAIAGRGMMQSEAVSDLEYLSDYIGPRLTGSPGAERAVEWGASRMKAIGLENVHTESYPVFLGWTRGPASAEILSPIHHTLNVDSMGWVGSTPHGGVTADAVAVNLYELDKETKDNSGKWAGKVLVMVTKGEAPKDGMSLFVKFGGFLEAAYKARAVAVIGGQGGQLAAGMNITHTGILGFAKYYDIPVLSMTREDQEQINRFLDQDKTVTLHIDVENHVTSGPVEAANVVGEIRGTERPEQIVVAGAHLDSWDLAEGATDNGVGVACVLEAARAILQSGYKPRRTIRFVLYTGEEQGLLGSLAYAKAHQDEVANTVAALTLDNGQGPVTNLDMGGRKDLIPAVEQFTKSVAAFGKITVDDKAEFDTDTGPFILQGLPGINMGQNSPDYRYTHHSPVDTFDHVNEDVLDRDATILALTAYWIASRPDRLASPWPPEKTAKMLVDQKADKLLKAFGLWTFGNLP